MDLTQAVAAVDCVETSLRLDLQAHANWLLDAIYCGGPELRDRVELLLSITGLAAADLIEAAKRHG